MEIDDSFYIDNRFIIFGQFSRPEIIVLKEINIDEELIKTVSLNKNYVTSDKNAIISKVFFDDDYRFLYRIDRSILITPNEREKITITFESFVNVGSIYNLVFSTKNERKVRDLNIVHKEDGKNNTFSLSVFLFRVLIEKYKKLYIFPLKELSKMDDLIFVTPIIFS